MSKRRRSTLSPNIDQESKKVKDSDEVFEFDISQLNLTPPRSFYTMASQGNALEPEHSTQSISKSPAPEVSRGILQGTDVSVTLSDTDIAKIATAVRALMQDDITALHERIHKLEARLDYYERSDKYNNICISGLKEDDESTDSVPLQQQVVTLASKIGVTLENTDVDRVFRTGKPDPDRARPVIVKLSNNYTKRQLLTNSQVLRKKQGYAGVYLNDDLTFANRKIAALARTRIREGKLQKTWSINGSIFVSDNLNRKVRINSEADIEIAIVKAMRDIKKGVKPLPPYRKKPAAGGSVHHSSPSKSDTEGTQHASPSKSYAAATSNLHANAPVFTPGDTDAGPNYQGGNILK